MCIMTKKKLSIQAKLADFIFTFHTYTKTNVERVENVRRESESRVEHVCKNRRRRRADRKHTRDYISRFIIAATIG